VAEALGKKRGNTPIDTTHRPQSSSASRLTAGAAGFLNLSQSATCRTGNEGASRRSPPVHLAGVPEHDGALGVLQVFI
jgi:hypothetical protein